MQFSFVGIAQNRSYCAILHGVASGVLLPLVSEGRPLTPPEGDSPPHSHTKKSLFYIVVAFFLCILAGGYQCYPHILSQKWDRVTISCKKNCFASQKKENIYKNTPSPLLPGGAVLVVLVVAVVLVVLVVAWQSPFLI